MEIQLKHVKEIVEVNSTYISGELKRKFIEFIETYDSMGLKIEDIVIDLGNKEFETEREDDIIEAETEEEIKDVPSVWVLIDDEDVPRFKPITTDVYEIDFNKAIKGYGIDIILLKTEFTEKIKKIKIKIGDELLEKIGTLREIQQFVLDTFEYAESKQQILDNIKESFFEVETVHSFMLEIPKHYEHIIMGITNE